MSEIPMKVNTVLRCGYRWYVQGRDSYGYRFAKMPMGLLLNIQLRIPKSKIFIAPTEVFSVSLSDRLLPFRAAKALFALELMELLLAQTKDSYEARYCCVDSGAA